MGVEALFLALSLPSCSHLNLFLCGHRHLVRIFPGGSWRCGKNFASLQRLVLGVWFGPITAFVLLGPFVPALVPFAGTATAGVAAKASAAMSWRPPLGLRAVVEAIAEQGALKEGESGAWATAGPVPP